MKKVLIADDEPSLRLLVHATLESDDYEILEAKDGLEALEVAQREMPELVILDVQMPGLDGFEVCRRLKNDEKTKNMMVVMLTSKSQATDREMGARVGANEYFTKPFSPLELMELVEKVLA